MRSKLRLVLEDVKNCAVTTDFWTSRANESYITVTCHFITADFQLHAAVLSSKNLLDETNNWAENISNSLLDFLIEWGVFEKVTAIVTDNARNMVKACEILQKRHVPCFAHSINLIVQDCLSQDKIKSIMAKCKKILSFFKISIVAYAKIKEAQCTDNPYSLKQECPTKWNSAFYMMERILLTKAAIGNNLLNTPKELLPLSADEISVLEELKQLLELFEHATRHTSPSTLVTVSMIIPVVGGLLHNLKGKLQTDEGREACHFLMDGVKQRLLQYEKRTVTRMLTLIDPRFKREGFLSTLNTSEAEKFLENELSSLNSALPRSPFPSATNLPTPISTTQQPLFEFLEITGRVDTILSLREYFNMENLESNLSSLDYWKI